MEKKPHLRLGHSLSGPYVHLIFTYPLTVLAICSFLFLVLPISFLFLRPLQIGNDPEKGFETDGTAYSGARLAWTQLQPAISQGSQVQLAPAGERIKRSWADELLASVGSVACYDEPIPTMSFLAQFIVQVPSLDVLFTRQFLTQICQLQQELSPSLSAFAQFSPFQTIWSFPNFLGCLVPQSRANCSFLTDSDISNFQRIFSRCLPHRQSLLACRRPCQPKNHFDVIPEGACPSESSVQDGGEGHCAKVPKDCDEQMWFDLFYRILPEDLSMQPLPINTFLPFFSLTAYRLQGIDIPLQAFTNFEAKLEAALEGKLFELKGLAMDTKRDLLLDAAIRDSRFSLMAALAVFLLLLVYSLSLAFALAVLLQLSAAVLSSLAIFRLFVPELPLLNVVAFILLISVGSDGAFLLLDTFPAAEKLSQSSLGRTLGHTAKTMFLTQFSTVVPFLLNLLSSVFAFRNFGLFAGLTLIFDYFLLISFLPAFLVLQSRYLNPWMSRFWPSRCWYCFPSSSSLDQLPNATLSSPSAPPPAHLLPSRVPSSRLDRSRHFFRTLLDEVLPAVLIQGRFVWLVSLLLFFAVSVHLALTQLSLPRYNPLQLFRASNPHEYFDQNAEQLFPFVADKIAGLPFALRLVWGIRPSTASSYFDPKLEQNPPQADARFKLDTPAQVEALAQKVEEIRQLPFANMPGKSWPERFVDWSRAQHCPPPPPAPSICCNMGSVLFSPDSLDGCIRLSTTFLLTGYNDTLIWQNQTHQLAGYTLLLNTRLPYSHRFRNLSASFALLDKSLFPEQIDSLPGWYTTEWTVISQWFDLQNGIISDCQQSFVVSFLVVFLFSALMLRLNAFCATLTIFCIVLCTIGTLVFLGWEIGVLEGVILVLVVGLSFDYTLHFGAVLPARGCAEHSIQQAVRRAIRPVGMSALSSVLAGGVMLLSETHAFFQVAIFLVVCSTLSFIFAIFFFLPLIYLLKSLRPSAECEWCARRRHERKCFKMNRLKLGVGRPSQE